MISLCATVFNEADSISAWVRGLGRQSRTPDEIVICDAGSTDGTVEALTELAATDENFHFLVVPGANISQGRNAAIEAARGDLIAVTDAGTVAEYDWLEQLVKPFAQDSGLGVSAGFYRPAGRDFFEEVLATVITPRFHDLYPDGFPPSSRSIAFRKDLWREVGGYPEWLRVCEDLVFDMNLKKAGARFAFTPDAVVAWYPRPDLRAFFKQYYGYARGDGHARIYAGRHFVRYGAYLTGLVLALSSSRSRLARVLLAIGMTFHFKGFVGRVFDGQPYSGVLGCIKAFALVPVVVVTGDVAKMSGYPRGVFERWRAGGEEGLLDIAVQPHRTAKTEARKIDF
ncbi:MAG: glycosyltransferase [Solirubrobacterales bacterium]